MFLNLKKKLNKSVDWIKNRLIGPPDSNSPDELNQLSKFNQAFLAIREDLCDRDEIDLSVLSYYPESFISSKSDILFVFESVKAVSKPIIILGPDETTQQWEYKEVVFIYYTKSNNLVILLG